MQSSETRLSVVVPLCGALEDFERSIGLNHPMLARAGIELVLAADAGLESAAVALMQGLPLIRTTVVLVSAPADLHWSARALNAGLRHCKGEFVLVCGDALAFVSDVPSQVVAELSRHPFTVLLGRCAQAPVARWVNAQSVSPVFDAVASTHIDPASLSGLTAAPRKAFMEVAGYDEQIAGEHANEDNLRIRLEAAGYGLRVSPQLQALHISDSPKVPRGWPDLLLNAMAYSPASALAGQGCMRGGLPEERAADVIAGTVPTERASPPLPSQDATPWAPLGSTRVCPVCYRYMHYQAVRGHCGLCAPQAAVAIQRSRILGVVQVRNEAALLKGCLDHLRPYVDGFVILDDGSTDHTPRVIEVEPKLAVHLRTPVVEPHHWDEKGNKLRLLRAAQRAGADWVLVCDADERLESLFLRHLRAVATTLGPVRLPCVSLALRELWDRPDQYRVDGVWGRKRVARFFKLPKQISFNSTSDLHGPWYPDEVRARGQFIATGYHMYHLRMIHAAQREARRDRYVRLDPDNRFQALGYDYLTDTSNGMVLNAIDPLRGYEMASAP
ncbi:glycosyltransferase [Ottowia thiooxydans]|uniref:Glycosyltransferase n=1 Tax=Ottowia thiooxydans TaxID=219182 RepID=A0ABV2QCJ2_9BURK